MAKAGLIESISYAFAGLLKDEKRQGNLMGFESGRNIRKERRGLAESAVYKRNGSSDRTRTYNPPVNSREKQ